MAGVVAQNYGDALFSLAKEEDKLKAYLDQLDMVLTSFQKEPDFLRLLAHPKMDKEQKKTMLDSVFKNGLDKEILNFMKLLVDKSRFSQFTAICQVFHTMYNQEFGIVIVYVTSAKPMSKQELHDITEVLETKTKKKVELVVQVDEDLLAGIRVKIGDQVIDNTARTRLANLKELVLKSEFTKDAR